MVDTVYIVTVTEEKDSSFCEVFVFHDIGKANLKLEELTYGTIDEEILTSITIYTGILLPASCLPASFDGTAPYIFIRNPDRVHDDSVSEEAYFWKSKSDPKLVAEKIEDIVGKELFGSLHEDILPSQISIDDIRLFLGYPMVPIIQVSETDFDEEVMDRFEKIKDDIFNIINQTGAKECQL
jgi:hypothetical protein